MIIITARPNQLFPALASGPGALMEKPLEFPKLLQTMRDLPAEPVEANIARLAGKPAEFDYLPAGKPLECHYPSPKWASAEALRSGGRQTLVTSLL